MRSQSSSTARFPSLSTELKIEEDQHVYEYSTELLQVYGGERINGMYHGLAQHLESSGMKETTQVYHGH